MKEEYEIVERFDITGRGTAVVIDKLTERVPGKEYKAQIKNSDGASIAVSAFKEWLLRRNSEPIEREAYLLKGVQKTEIAENAVISFL
ncbi:hypothetical protein KFE80_00305 [bacterium SCSIO 12696]|nr:hypothetical protein KFE80_00305 [bacterium SCSIO 12696]